MEKNQEPSLGKAEYVYSSSEVSKFYGLTVKGMEYYEQCGLVTPERVGQGKVRRYSLADNYRLYFTRLYKNVGLGIQKTAELLENNTPENLEGELEEQIRLMRREVWLHQRMLEELEHTREMLLRLPEMPAFTVREEEGFYRLFIRRFYGPHRSNREETLEYKTWNDYLPVTAASLRFPLADCLRGGSEMDTEIGLLVRRRDFERLGLRESGRTSAIPAGRFLRTLLCGEAEELSSTKWIRPALEYMRANHLTQTGDAFTRMIAILKRDGKELRCDEAWFPVADG